MVKQVAEIARDVEIVAREVRGHCAAGIRVGDKIVLRGANVSKEESGPICGYAFCSLYPAVFAARMGVDYAHLGLDGRLWQCVDPGPPHTSGGTVLFEIKPLNE
ncbi:MAG: TIGR04076 family protein [Bacillota bacterium]